MLRGRKRESGHEKSAVGARRRERGGRGKGRAGTPQTGDGLLPTVPSCPPAAPAVPSAGARSRACCSCEERPRRFTAVTFSMHPGLKLLFVSDSRSKGATISRQLKSAGKGRREAAFTAMCSPGRTCLQGGGAVYSENNPKYPETRGPRNFPLPRASARAQEGLEFTWEARLGNPPSRPGCV